MHFYGWKKGLKTGMYYLRTRPAAQAIQFTVDQTLLAKSKETNGTPVSPVTLRKVRPPYVPKVTTMNSTPKRSETSTPVSWMENKRTNSGILSPSTPTDSADVSEKAGTPAEPSGAVLTSPPDTTTATGTSAAFEAPSVSFDGTDTEARAARAAQEDPEFAAALARQRERELEEAKLMCSIENKEACMMCSG